MKSTPRVTPYSLSPAFRCFRFRGDAGAGEDLFRFCEVDADDSAASRWVDVTARFLVIQIQKEVEETHTPLVQRPPLHCQHLVQWWRHSHLTR